MNSHFILAASSPVVLSACCSFLAKVTAAYCLFWSLSKVATSAAARYVLWLFYLLGTATYWLYTLANLGAGASYVPPASRQFAASSSGITFTLTSSVAQLFAVLLQYLLLLYLVTLLIMAGLGLWRRWRLARALTYKTVPPDALQRIFAGVRSELSVSRCDLWLLPGLASPAALGWWRPAVYLPVDCTDDSETELHSILRHELSHVLRRDGLWENVSRACRFLVFFHPCIHKAFSALRIEREMACDMVVIRSHPEKRDLYAETLVRFGWKTSLAREMDHIGIGFTSQAAVLRARVNSILAGERVYSPWARGGRAVVGTAVCWLFAVVVPLLWIGFGMPSVPQPVLASAQTLSSQFTPRRHQHVRPASGAPSIQVASQPAAHASDILPLPVQPPARTRGFRAQNEDEPMSNPVAEMDETRPKTDDPTRATRSGSARLPSPTSVLLDSAAQLGRMGTGHDHDRD